VAARITLPDRAARHPDRAEPRDVSRGFHACGRAFSDASSALVIGNPLVDAEDVTAAPNLPEAEAEAKRRCGTLPTRRAVHARAATKAVYLRAPAITSSCIRGTRSRTRPSELSRILLAWPDATSRNLFAREIALQSFPSTQLVVLGACRTTAGRIRRGEGVFSLARPFLAAGVPIVVASLWDVDDRASRRLLSRFTAGCGRAQRDGRPPRRAARSDGRRPTRFFGVRPRGPGSP